jgi:dipeptidyl-peptidase-4
VNIFIEKFGFMKNALCCISLLLILSCTSTKEINTAHQNPQPTTQQTDEGILSIDDVFSGKHRANFFDGISWRRNGHHFTRIEQGENGNEMIQYDAQNAEKEIVISSSQLVLPGQNKPLNVEGYEWSDNEKLILLYTNSKRVWRENTRGDYWIFNMSSKTLNQIGKDLPASSLMFAKFSPDGNQVGYVSGHNVYVEDLKSQKITQLTTDGSEDMINGTFDWAYEEELFCKDGFRWSPDSKRIAFWQIDASDIGDYLMINTTDSIYPFTIPVEYPKAGSDPSAAKIGVVDLSSGRIDWMKIPGDPKQHYLPRLQWIDGSQMIVQQLNRKQNELTLWSCDPVNGEVTKFYTESDPAWVDLVHMDITSPWEMLDLPNYDDALYRLTEKDGRRHIYKIPIDGTPEVLVTDWPHDIARYYTLGLSDRTGYVNASPDNATQRYLFQISMDGDFTPKRITPVGYAGINRYDISPNGTYALHTHSSAMTPTSVHLIRLPEHEIIHTFAENQAYLSKLKKEVKMPSVEFFKVTTDDGVEMDGRMLKPYDFDPAKKYPVIFNLYGEPAGQTAVDQWSGFLWPVMMTQKGFVYITLDNRGTPSLKGREWRKSIYRKVGILNSRDQAMAARKIAEWPFVDGERLGVWGWSGGGSMTLNLMFRYPDVYHTGVAVAAVANQLYYDNIYQERYMGLPSENMQDFIDGSPIHFAKNLQGNLLYIHGTADDNVHYQNAEALINELVKQDKQFDLMSYPGRSHGIWEGQGTTRHLYTLIMNYFEEHLLED